MIPFQGRTSRGKMGKSRCISAGFIGFLTVKPVHASSLRAQGPLSRSPVLSVQLGDCGLGSHLLGPPQKSCAFWGPHSLKFLGRSQSALRQKNSRPQPGILFGRAFRRGSLALAKEARDRQSVSPSYPFSLAIAALAAICSALPKKLRFPGTPFSFIPRAESIRPPAMNTSTSEAGGCHYAGIALCSSRTRATRNTDLPTA